MKEYLWCGATVPRLLGSIFESSVSSCGWSRPRLPSIAPTKALPHFVNSRLMGVAHTHEAWSKTKTMSVNVDDVNLCLESEGDYDTEVIHEVTCLTEEELFQLLPDDLDLQEEIFDVPFDAVQPLLICFLQRCIKVIPRLPTGSSYAQLEYALDMISKLTNQVTAPDQLKELSSSVAKYCPGAISVLLDFVLRIWQGLLYALQADELPRLLFFCANCQFVLLFAHLHLLKLILCENTVVIAGRIMSIGQGLR